MSWDQANTLQKAGQKAKKQEMEHRQNHLRISMPFAFSLFGGRILGVVLLLEVKSETFRLAAHRIEKVLSGFY